MSDQVNNEQTKTAKQEKATELSDDKLDEVAGGFEFQELTLLNRDRPGGVDSDQLNEAAGSHAERLTRDGKWIDIV